MRSRRRGLIAAGLALIGTGLVLAALTARAQHQTRPTIPTHYRVDIGNWPATGRHERQV